MTASADQIAHSAKRYTLVEGDFYRHGANGVLMWCIIREEGCELLTEVHGGECGNTLLLAHWSVNPFDTASTSLQLSRMPSSW
jgi:hypothetical protein